jgi:hypothetical protein
MYFEFKCGCGLKNSNLEDWLSHWKHGLPREDVWYKKYPKLNAVVLLLKTEVILVKEYTDRYIIGNFLAKFFKPRTLCYSDGELISAGFFKMGNDDFSYGWNFLFPCSKEAVKKYFKDIY